jgi:hypothetical protein
MVRFISERVRWGVKRSTERNDPHQFAWSTLVHFKEPGQIGFVARKSEDK